MDPYPIPPSPPREVPQYESCSPYFPFSRVHERVCAGREWYNFHCRVLLAEEGEGTEFAGGFGLIECWGFLCGWMGEGN